MLMRPDTDMGIEVAKNSLWKSCCYWGARFVDGTALLNEIARRIKARKKTKTITDAALAKELGVTQPALSNYRKPNLTPRQAVNLMEKFAKQAEKKIVAETIVPIVEFFHLDPIETKQGKSWQLFSTKDDDGNQHPYLQGLKERLEEARGIYIFHDSRGRAIYAGKAQRLSLWTEMNNAFNRDRGEVQNIKRVGHPTNRVAYRGLDEKKRQIVKEAIALHHIASYMSAYKIPNDLIGKFEALIVRSFANDLLNVRMENF
jgi:predicted transcriptional regulator